jgi:thiamine pyrophosphokinase
VGFLIRKKLPLFAFGDSREMLFFLCSEESLKLEFSGSLPGVFSLFPLTEECRGVTSRGTRWDLESVTLRQRYPYAISNEILLEGEEECSARVEQGILGVYAWWG